MTYDPLLLQVVSELVESARNNDYTDVVMIHEHRGEPDGLVVCHMPYGPSAYFGIFNTVHAIHQTNKKSVFLLVIVTTLVPIGFGVREGGEGKSRAVLQSHLS